MPSQKSSPHLIENICLARLDAFSEALLKEPAFEDPEYVHQLRVATRRIEACLAVFRPVLEAGGLSDASAAIRSFVQILGEARDCDMYVQFLSGRSRSKKTASCRDGLWFMYEEARRARKRAYTKIRSAVVRMRQSPAVAQVKRIVRDHATGRMNRGDSLELLRCSMKDAMKEVKRCEKAVFRTSRDKKLHALRIALKHLRYTAELIHSTAPKSRLLGRGKRRRSVSTLSDRWKSNGLIDALRPRTVDTCLAVLKRSQGLLGDIHDYHQWEQAIDTIKPAIVSRLQDLSYLELSYSECDRAVRLLKKYLRKRRKKEVLRFRKLWRKIERKRLLKVLITF